MYISKMKNIQQILNLQLHSHCTKSCDFSWMVGGNYLAEFRKEIPTYKFYEHPPNTNEQNKRVKSSVKKTPPTFLTTAPHYHRVLTRHSCFYFPNLKKVFSFGNAPPHNYSSFTLNRTV